MCNEAGWWFWQALGCPFKTWCTRALNGKEAAFLLSGQDNKTKNDCSRHAKPNTVMPLEWLEWLEWWESPGMVKVLSNRRCWWFASLDNLGFRFISRH
jgi:hypothetical protein